MKQIIRLTESDLRRLVKESVRMVLEGTDASASGDINRPVFPMMRRPSPVGEATDEEVKPVDTSDTIDRKGGKNHSVAVNGVNEGIDSANVPLITSLHSGVHSLVLNPHNFKEIHGDPREDYYYSDAGYRVRTFYNNFTREEVREISLDDYNRYELKPAGKKSWYWIGNAPKGSDFMKGVKTVQNEKIV